MMSFCKSLINKKNDLRRIEDKTTHKLNEIDKLLKKINEETQKEQVSTVKDSKKKETKVKETQDVGSDELKEMEEMKERPWEKYF